MVRILIIEDNEMNRDMLSRRLQNRGYQVSHAVDGLEGLNMAKATRPDLILMDMSLPIMDGWEATHLLKSQDITKTIPVIGLTAHAMLSDRENALAIGCDEFDTKPVEFQRLIEKIESLLAPEVLP
jgi:two-component system, cell cycle response regulator DivK